MQCNALNDSVVDRLNLEKVCTVTSKGFETIISKLMKGIALVYLFDTCKGVVELDSQSHNLPSDSADFVSRSHLLN